MQDNQSVYSALHFKYHRVIEYIKFYYHYSKCKLFHEQEEPKWESWKGAILCTCGVGIDLGLTYAQHCEECWNYAHQKTKRRECQ